MAAEISRNHSVIRADHVYEERRVVRFMTIGTKWSRVYPICKKGSQQHIRNTF